MSKQQFLNYEAEDSVWPIFPPSLAAHEYLTPPIGQADLAGYVHHLQRQPWFAAQFPNQGEPIEVKAGRADHGSTGDQVTRRIRIGGDHRRTAVRCEWVLLHELAHVVTSPAAPGRRRHEGHCTAWRRNFIWLVNQQLGYRAARYLRAAFGKRGLGKRSSIRDRVDN